MTYATKQETESLIRQATPFEKWLESELDRIAPNRHEMGSYTDAHYMYQLLKEIWEKQNAQKV